MNVLAWLIFTLRETQLASALLLVHFQVALQGRMQMFILWIITTQAEDWIYSMLSGQWALLVLDRIFNMVEETAFSLRLLNKIVCSINVIKIVLKR